MTQQNPIIPSMPFVAGYVWLDQAIDYIRRLGQTEGCPWYLFERTTTQIIWWVES